MDFRGSYKKKKKKFKKLKMASSPPPEFSSLPEGKSIFFLIKRYIFDFHLWSHFLINILFFEKYTFLYTF